MECKPVYMAIGNYYGAPYVQERDGKYFFCLDDWDGTSEVEVSKDFYAACVKEFASSKDSP